jgi:hypothetical protein
VKSNRSLRIICMLKRVRYTKSFWISKYIADAFDGKTLSLLIDEEELGRKYHCDKEPLQGDQYAKT